MNIIRIVVQVQKGRIELGVAIHSKKTVRAYKNRSKEFFYVIKTAATTHA